MTNGNNDPNAGRWLEEALGLRAGETPFPWQEQLLKRLCQGDIPPALDIPTGLGKTAVMAIWLVARARGATLPRRIAYVVDRRAVVDQATAEAERLRQWVEACQDVKRALGLTRGLPISTLRGQHVDNREWLDDPAAPAIVVGTVDMIGSRLLFEGYGVSRKMRPYHAALLGADTLVVLDEAHLVPPFERLLDAIARNPNVFGWTEPVPPFRLLSLSATGRKVKGALELTPADLKHPVVQKRLSAPKRLRVRTLDGDVKLAEALADEAWKLTDNGRKPTRCIVFCNKREDAQRALQIIEKRRKGDTKAGISPVEVCSELFVGGRRVYEREEAARRLGKLGFLARTSERPQLPVFLFATSAAEVGVDLDADHIVCDLAWSGPAPVAWERMVQRLGRVNRRGDGHASVIVLVEPEPKNIDDLLKKAPGDRSRKEAAAVERFERTTAVRKALERLPLVDGTHDASPGALRTLKQHAEVDPGLKIILDAATTSEPLRPALSRPLVEAWSLTSLENHTGRPAGVPWLRGWIEDDPPQSAVVWRRFLPVRTGGGGASRKEIEGFFEAAPPHTSELLETETFRAVGWLMDRAIALRSMPRESHVDDAAATQALRFGEAVAFVLARDGTLRTVLRLDDLVLPADKNAAKERRDNLHGVLAEATVVVDARIGGLKDGLLDASEGALPRTADHGDAWLGEGTVRFRVRSVGASESVASDPMWRERLRFPTEVSEDGEARRWLVIEKWRHHAATEEDRSAARPQLLDEHESWAEERARAVAKALGLDQHADMLGIAARLHDEGKRATRWQRAFNAPPDGPYAKTRGPINYSLLGGYRHELGSLAYAERDPRLLALSEEQRDLALHLIAAHHGFARPVIGTRGYDDAPPSMLTERATEIAQRFARLQARWGPWGLAWWEALLRAADQQASRDNDERDSGGGQG
ncbi:MAG: type I-U CRISPR-associated helicase/endonuclease Cas3 [Acidobacteria bacterium]|nr:type I-U CRISPR-associated helicase/endonuclease Cas3 [Acidobacteriota bacterium]